MRALSGDGARLDYAAELLKKVKVCYDTCKASSGCMPGTKCTDPDDGVGIFSVMQDSHFVKKFHPPGFTSDKELKVQWGALQMYNVLKLGNNIAPRAAKAIQRDLERKATTNKWISKAGELEE